MSAEDAMAWYNDPTRKTYVATYKSNAAMRKEMESASRYGFTSQAMTQRGRELTVSYVRDERAWARIQAQTAQETLRAQQRDSDAVQAALPGLMAQVEAAFRAARTESSDPVKLEQLLLKAVTDVIGTRTRGISLLHGLISTYTLVKSTGEQAAELQAGTQSGINIDTEVNALRARIETEEEHVAVERALQQAQQAVVVQVQPWKRIVGDRWGADARLQGTKRALATIGAQQQVASAPDAPESSPALPNPKIAAASAKHTQRQGALDELDTKLLRQEQTLLQSLEARDQQMAEFTQAT